MFPCKQMEVNDKYREGWDEIFGKKENKNKLALCPFCGCDKVIEDSLSSIFDFRCPQCSARVCFREKKKFQAVEMWNNRKA